MAGLDLPSRAIREQIVSAIDLLIHVRRCEDGVRRIESIAEISGLEGATPLLQEIFVFRRRGRQGRRLLGEFSATGVIPKIIEELRDQGNEISLDIFHKRAGDDSN
jgi:pilus assembly protein CpaF